MSYIWGKNSVNEAIKAKRVNELLISDKTYISIAKKERLRYTLVTKKELDKIADGNHQGIVAEVFEYETYDLEDIMRDHDGLIVMLDGLEDPRNLGAMIRTADCAAVDGIIYRKDRSVHVTPTVAKVASGALEYVKIVEVTNLVETVKRLKERGYWIVGTDGSAEIDYTSLDYDMNTVIIIGSEGKGISRLLLKECDYVVKMPLLGHVNSLNASVACGIMLYEVLEKRSNR